MKLRLAYCDGVSMASDGPSREKGDGDGYADLQNQENHEEA